MQFTVEDDATKTREVLNAFAQLSEAVEKPFTRTGLGQAWPRDIREISEDRWQNAGYGWQEPAASTFESKEAKVGMFAHLTLLVDTGALKASFTKAGDTNAILEISDSEIAFGSALRYARYHHSGTSRMPQRKLVDFSRPQDADKLNKTALKEFGIYNRTKLGFTQTDITDFD
jgi:hypothetical protein